MPNILTLKETNGFLPWPIQLNPSWITSYFKLLFNNFKTVLLLEICMVFIANIPFLIKVFFGLVLLKKIFISRKLSKCKLFVVMHKFSVDINTFLWYYNKCTMHSIPTISHIITTLSQWRRSLTMEQEIVYYKTISDNRTYTIAMSGITDKNPYFYNSQTKSKYYIFEFLLSGQGTINIDNKTYFLKKTTFTLFRQTVITNILQKLTTLTKGTGSV